ncbi:hypothetical protein [Candidatus Chloroploca asiatica]|uniref:CopG family transcriptional regulator n=1 Tax=Candidatus Chloroploca asiatica TaxID=1506545 RepID=A0A2H3KQ00_9CHLR|nr:hypothetical protein [Candidatus Chloroploca asiatica]PDW00397.1 hypothetical protein A9Q02_21740 [Candidatus Chloroploca asiatica]
MIDQSVTITHLDQAVTEWIEGEAQRTGQSVEAIVRWLLVQGMEVARHQGTAQRYHDLDDLAGTWSAADAVVFQQALDDMNQLDPTLWQ